MLTRVRWSGLWRQALENRSLSTTSARTKGSAVDIDGRHGEVGGQIVRSALALSMATGRPFRVKNVRRNRAVEGLQHQHLASVLAAQEICSAEVRGASIGSTDLSFTPGRVHPGEYTFRAGTAGSAVLVFQTLLPALMCAGERSTLVLHGGTHNPYTPTFDFLQTCYLPAVKLLGPSCEALLQRPGFYPDGGGRFRVNITPTSRSRLRFLQLLSRGRVLRKDVYSVYAKHNYRYANQQARDLIEHMNWLEVSFYNDEWEADCAGMALAVVIEAERINECFTSVAIPRQRRPMAPLVEVVTRLQSYLASHAAVGEFLADQLIVPMALGRGGEFLCTKATSHTLAQIDLVKKFLDVDVIVENSAERGGVSVLIHTQ
mmetsp:Transcript_11351/g.34743  ORF Transcript_11351/g.34743 Transcript_11351/m.34743 type:complete len:374 (-) Transcript_11351:504-1625(-)